MVSGSKVRGAGRTKRVVKVKERGSHVEIEPKKSATGRGAELKLAQTSFKRVRDKVCWAFYLKLCDKLD